MVISAVISEPHSCLHVYGSAKEETLQSNSLESWARDKEGWGADRERRARQRERERERRAGQRERERYYCEEGGRDSERMAG